MRTKNVWKCFEQHDETNGKAENQHLNSLEDKSISNMKY